MLRRWTGDCVCLFAPRACGIAPGRRQQLHMPIDTHRARHAIGESRRECQHWAALQRVSIFSQSHEKRAYLWRDMLL